MVFRSRILICFQKPQDLLQKSDANEDDEEEDEDDDDEEEEEAEEEEEEEWEVEREASKLSAGARIRSSL